MAKSIAAIDNKSIHRITSGQVVIDLQTAVKELVENSLDAGATSIEVRFKNYGVKSIEVIDNGSGIREEDYDSIALKYHTSKLSNYDDLTTVKTFGFRGEALSSLCALCETVTVTTASQPPIGHVLEMDSSGKAHRKGKTARQRGTTIVLTNPFAPLPVRRKELERNAKREFGKAIALLNAYALVPCSGAQGVRLTVSNQTEKGQKSVQFRTQGAPSLRSVVTILWGPKALENIVDLDLSFTVIKDVSALRRVKGETTSSESIDIKVQGLVSKFAVGCGRTSTDRQFFYINGRPCSLNKVQKAFNEVYRSFNATQSPFVVADFIIPTDSCDINVSPDKRTIFLHNELNLLGALKAQLEVTFAPSRSTYDVRSGTTETQEGDSTHLGLRHVTHGDGMGDTVPLGSVEHQAAGSTGRSSSPTLMIDVDADTLVDVAMTSFEAAPRHTNDIESVSASTSQTTPFQQQIEVEERIADGRAPAVTLDTSNAFWNKPRKDTRTRSPSLEYMEGPQDRAPSEPPRKKRKSEPPPTASDEDNSSLRSEMKRKENPTQQDIRQHLTSFAKPKNDETRLLERKKQPNDLSHISHRSLTPPLQQSEPLEETLSDPMSIDEPGDTPVKPAAPLHPEVIRSVDNNGDITLRCDLARISARWTSQRTSSHDPIDEESGGLRMPGAIGLSQGVDDQAASAALSRVIEKQDFEVMEILGQFNLGFILVRLAKAHERSRTDDLFIIDQHAADEKYNFEDLQQSTSIKSQRLLRAEPLELTVTDELVALDNLPVLRQNGFEIHVDDESDGPDRVHRLKLLAKPVSKNTVFDMKGQPDLEEIITLLHDRPGKMVRCSKARAMFASRACRKSVMIGMPLTHRQMTTVVRHMGTMDQPWNCPHGRPTMRHLYTMTARPYSFPKGALAWDAFFRQEN